MSEKLLEKNKDSNIKELLNNIITKQKEEIKYMKEYLHRSKLSIL
jgi:uncharacterized protein (DUF305 family)